ncbi:MAG: DUF4148 domain-containing protein [Caldimonas sp.]
MNAKLLFAATVALSIASTFAMADPAQPVTREQVLADYAASAANGTLRKNDYDYAAHDFAGTSTKSRDQVVAEMVAARSGNTLVGPMRNKTYNLFGTETLRPAIYTRAEVKSEVLAARQDGTLRSSDYADDSTVHIAHRSIDRSSRPVLAQALKGQRAGS